MINLESVSGLPIALDPETNKLKFRQPLDEINPTVRKFSEMKDVFMDQDAKPSFDEMYYMYRNVHFKEHEQQLADLGVSYDITVIPAGKVGAEFNKTVGHYHAVKAGTPFAYPEVYEVLHGHGLFLLQKMDALFQDLVTVIAMEAKAGDKVIYPPNYGHIIVNIGGSTLVTGNYVADKFERMYKQVTDRKGMAYYVVEDGHGYTFIKNQNYEKHPEVRMLTSQFMKNFAIMGKDPMYRIGTSTPKALEFLNHPEKYAVELSSITS
jgi:glucose-6-phosphate isomerase, archaeal